MLELYLTVLNMSLTAALAALIIIILRGSLGRALPRTFSYAIWAIVLYRMICPVSFPSIFSMLERIKPGLDAYTSTLKAVSLTEALGFEVLSGHRAQELGLTPNLLQETPIETTGGLTQTPLTAAPMSIDYVTVVLTMLWVLGIFALLLYNAVSYRRLCMSMSTSTFFEDYQLVKECKTAICMKRRVDVYESDKVESPFVYGIFRPRVMLPVSAAYSSDGQEREQLRHILLHELYHIKRFDYLVKPLAFLALCVHWFNPVLWAAFRLFDKDMEMSCDEGAVKALKTGTCQDYAATLLTLASSQGRIGKSCALAFRETNAGERVKHIVKYKKPGLAVGVISVILIILCAVGLLSNPTSLAGELEDGQANVLVMCSAEDSNIPDTILLMGYNGDRKEVNIAFLPRDLEVLPDDGSYGIAERKLSGYAGGNPPEEVMKRLREMLGIEIHNYIKLDTGNFRDLVDALGGVEFNVPIKMVYEDPYQNLAINLEKGRQVLDGEKAEMLIRYRKGYPEGDLARIEVQKAFLGAMIEQKSDIKIGSVKEIYQLLSKEMETDLGIEKAKKLFTLSRTAKTIAFVDVPILQDSEDPLAPLLLAPEAKDQVKEKF
ncbi:M56 family metallopeptidase [Sinanaerobacter chloroacetimidivorans]|nr:M56 family metallopeptidase [Sinanaerobacter chloroacetimidivorans]